MLPVHGRDERAPRDVVKGSTRSGSLWSVAAVGFATVALLALGKLLTNSLPPAGVGQVALTLLVAEFVGLFGGLGIPTALPKLLAAAKEDEGHHLTRGLLRLQFRVALALATLVLLLVMARPLWPQSIQFILPDTPALAGALPLLVVVVLLRDFLLAALAGRQYYRRRACAMMLMPGLLLVEFTALFQLDSPQPIAFLFAHGLAGIGGIVLLLGGLHRPDDAKGREPRAVPNALRFATPLYINNIMNFVYQRVDTLLIVAWLDLGTAAIFEMAKRLPGLLSRVLRAALIPYLPTLAERLRDGNTGPAGQLIQQTMTLTAMAGYGVTLFLIAVANPLLAILFTSDYQSGTQALGLLLIATCLAVQAGIIGQALIALDRPKTVMHINLGLGLLSLTLNLVLVPRFGIVGAGWSAVAAATFSLALQQVAVLRAGIAQQGTVLLRVHLFFCVALGLFYWLGDAMVPRLVVAVIFPAACFAAGATTVSSETREITS